MKPHDPALVLCDFPLDFASDFLSFRFACARGATGLCSCNPSEKEYPIQTAITPIPLTDHRKSVPSLAADAIKDLALRSLDADKAEDIETIDLQGHSSLADYIVIASGRSARQVSALADNLVDRLLEQGVRTRTEGLRNGDWVIVDAGDVIVHIFRPEVRTFYNIEKMWRGTALFDQMQ